MCERNLRTPNDKAKIGPLGVIGGVKCVTPITFFQTDSSTLKLKCNYGVIGGVKCVTPIIVAHS